MKRPNSTLGRNSKSLNPKVNAARSIKVFLLLMAMIVYSLFAYVFGNESICIFKVYVGLPCPGCGMTRSFLSLAQGHLHEAFYWHPLWPLVFIGPALYLILDQRVGAAKGKAVLIWSIFVIFVSTYAYRMYLYFPLQAPMDYNNHAYFYRIYEYFVK